MHVRVHIHYLEALNQAGSWENIASTHWFFLRKEVREEIHFFSFIPFILGGMREANRNCMY